jgi:hypothetical protein
MRPSQAIHVTFSSSRQFSVVSAAVLVLPLPEVTMPEDAMPDLSIQLNFSLLKRESSLEIGIVHF